MQKNLALIAKYFKKIYKPTNNNLRTSSNTRNKNVDTTPRYKNDNQSGQFGNQRAEFGHFAKECKKPKQVKDSTYHKEKMLLCKQAEKGVQLQAEQSDCYRTKKKLMNKSWKHITVTWQRSRRFLMQTQALILSHWNMYNNRDDQNDVECDDERVALANLIANLKLDVDENKKIQKQLKKVNATFTIKI
ncbi:hypothetical protein Tco_0121241 [Tanacetum coccineum]